MRSGEQVETNPKPFPALQELRLILAEHLLRRNPLLLRRQRNRRAVRVAPRHHQHLIALDAMIAREYIRRQVRPRHMPDMDRAVGIRPSDRRKYALRHKIAQTR